MRGAPFLVAFIFLSWFALGVVWMWLKYKRDNAIIELLKVYVAQGKEPPPELLNGLKSSKEPQAQGTLRTWKHVATCGSLSLGFGAAYLAMVPQVMSPGRAHPFLVTSIIMGALTLGALVNVLIQRKYDSK